MNEEYIPLPSLERAVRAADLRLVQYEKKDPRSKQTYTCYFVHKFGEQTGVYSQNRNELRDMLLQFWAAKAVRNIDIVLFAGSQGFKIKTVPIE